MKKNSLRLLVGTAVFAALVCAATMVITIPVPVTGGYIYPGDGIALLAGWMLGPVWGFAAAGIGSAMADLLLGYVVYVPGTLIIKGMIGLLAGLIARALKRRRLSAVIAAVAAEAVMVLGYFLYESVILGYGMAAAAAVPGNLIQALGGIVIFAVLSAVLRPVRIFEQK